jgi:hypothetical protein
MAAKVLLASFNFYHIESIVLFFKKIDWINYLGVTCQNIFYFKIY